MPTRRFLAAFAVRLSCISWFSVLAACGGGGGGGPSARPGAFQLFADSAEGPRNVESSGIDVVVGGNTVRVSVVQTDGPAVADVTARATWEVDDNAIATLDEGALVGLVAGTTQVRATIDGVRLAAAVRSRAAADTPIVDFWFEDADDLVFFEATAKSLSCEGRLASGDLVPVGDRLQWRSLNTGVATIANGTVQPVADGATTLQAVDPASGRTRDKAVVVALPRPSGSVLGAAGGRIVNGAASVWVPPFALGANAAVQLEQVDPQSLPAGPPPGPPPLATLRMQTPQAQFGRPVQFAFQAPTDTLGALIRVQILNPVTQQWQHFAFVQGQLGLLSWIALFPGVFSLSTEANLVETLAQRHAPTFAIDDRDIGPISFEYLLAHSRLRRNVVLGIDPVVASPATLAQLANHDSANHYVQLADDEAAEFEADLDWGDARMGGMRRLGEWAPTVYWSLRGQQWRGAPGEATKHLILVQYWLLYAASALPATNPAPGILVDNVYHDGDLEFCQIILDAGQDPPTPIAATTSQHYYGEGRHYRDVETVGESALFYVAQRSHATHFDRGFGGSGDQQPTGTGDCGFLRKLDAPRRVATPDRRPITRCC